MPPHLESASPAPHPPARRRAPEPEPEVVQTPGDRWREIGAEIRAWGRPELRESGVEDAVERAVRVEGRPS